MNKTLQEKNDRLKLLEQSNSDLNQKLIEYEVIKLSNFIFVVDINFKFQRQNRENIIIAKNEIHNLSNNLEQSAQNQASLDQELLKTKSQLNEILRVNFKLEKENKDSLNSKQKVFYLYFMF